MKESEVQKLFVLRQSYRFIILAYVMVVIFFYILCGDQLFYRKSLSPIHMQPATSGTIELSEGHSVKQVFFTAVERIETVSVQWGTYYRPNAGVVHISLYEESTGKLLIEDNIDVACIQEGDLTTIKANEPIENMIGIPLVLEITSDSMMGQSMSPLMAVTSDFQNLYIDDVPVEKGILCFSVDGTDFIKHSKFYWPLVVIIGIFLSILFYYLYSKYKRNGKETISEFIISFYEYRFLFKQLVSRDFKSKYKRSVLGMMWSILNPVLMMSVQYYVFSTIFKTNVEYYSVYLLLGIICFNFFSEVCNASLASIVINVGLINKVYVPKYLYPITKSVSALINFGLSMIPLVVVMIWSKVPFSFSMILALFGVAFLIMFATGIGLALASSMVFFRDTQFLWGLFCMILLYVTPIFYTEDILPESMRIIFKTNPMYHILIIIRTAIIHGVSADPVEYIYAGIMSISVLLVGAYIFYKSQDKFILYL